MKLSFSVRCKNTYHKWVSNPHLNSCIKELRQFHRFRPQGHPDLRSLQENKNNTYTAVWSTRLHAFLQILQWGTTSDILWIYEFGIVNRTTLFPCNKHALCICTLGYVRSLITVILDLTNRVVTEALQTSADVITRSPYLRERWCYLAPQWSLLDNI